MEQPHQGVNFEVKLLSKYSRRYSYICVIPCYDSWPRDSICARNFRAEPRLTRFKIFCAKLLERINISIYLCLMNHSAEYNMSAQSHVVIFKD
jgi:hypothetical protein